jgi:hypothetical protein
MCIRMYSMLLSKSTNPAFDCGLLNFVSPQDFGTEKTMLLHGSCNLDTIKLERCAYVCIEVTIQIKDSTVDFFCITHIKSFSFFHSNNNITH